MSGGARHRARGAAAGRPGRLLGRWPRRWWGRLGCGVLSLGLLVSGCGDEEPAPVRAARQFASAARAGDVEEVLARVDAQTVARVRQAAQRASDQVGGRRSVELHEMLQVVDVDPRFQVKSAELVEGDEQRAVVRLVGAEEGTSHTLELIFEEGSWRVHLPLPRGPMVEP